MWTPNCSRCCAWRRWWMPSPWKTPLRLTHLGQGRYDVDDVIAKLAAPRTHQKRPIDRARTAGAVQPAAAGRARGLYRQRCGQDAFGARPAARCPSSARCPTRKKCAWSPGWPSRWKAARFDSSAQSTPFAQTRHADAHIRWDDLDLAPTWATCPPACPFSSRRPRWTWT